MSLAYRAASPTPVAALLAALLVATPLRAANVSFELRDAGGRPLADAVVRLESLDAAPDAVPATRAVIDQRQRRFVPRVSVIRRGAVVKFPNSDNVRHHVYSFSAAKTFDLRLYAGLDAPPVTFDRAGLVVLGCNIHDTMVAFVAVVDTPHFGLTSADGRIALELPRGRYRLRAWHPDQSAPFQAQVLTVEESALRLPVTLQTGTPLGGAGYWAD